MVGDDTLYLGEPTKTLTEDEVPIVGQFLAPGNVYAALGVGESNEKNNHFYTSLIVSEPKGRRLLGTVETDEHNNVLSLVIQRLSSPADTIMSHHPSAPKRQLNVEAGVTLDWRLLNPEGRQVVDETVQQHVEHAKRQPSSGRPRREVGARASAWARAEGPNIAAWLQSLQADSASSVGTDGESAQHRTAGASGARGASSPDAADQSSARFSITEAAITAHAYHVDPTRSHLANLQDAKAIRAALSAAGFDVWHEAVLQQVLDTLKLAPPEKYTNGE